MKRTARKYYLNGSDAVVTYPVQRGCRSCERTALWASVELLAAARTEGVLYDALPVALRGHARLRYGARSGDGMRYFAHPHCGCLWRRSPPRR